jgi:outer membrane protein assembly factor BamD (BamD/ComL family)
MKFLFTAAFTLYCFLMAVAQDRDTIMARITAEEVKLFADSDGELSPKEVERIIPLYLDFVNQFPDDPLSPDYLFKAGEVAQGLGYYMQSVEYFNGVHMRYPTHERAPYALFFQGFVFYNYLEIPTYAKGSFLDFLDKYPGHILEKDVRALLQLLHSSEEEYFRIIIEKNK